MAWRACAVALWCAVLVAGAAAYTVDCNHEYTDCDTELSKLTNDDEELSSLTRKSVPTLETSPTTIITTTTSTTEKPETTTEKKLETTKSSSTEKPEAPELSETPEAKKARLLNLNVDDLQNFANAIHNQTQSSDKKKAISDLSDVNLDDDDDEPSRMVQDHNKHNKQISDKFYTNLQAPFNPLLTIASEEVDTMNTCKENGITYKIGERMDRGCEETCECVPGGSFECSARCKHPYIRQGRRLNDPLCFETPVDECCSIIACATGNGENKPTRIDVCRYGNDTYPVGAKWNIGCEQKCSCEVNSVVTCKPRCKVFPPSEQCINVQDPNDACCEIQICDVSQDVHEEPIDNITSSTTKTTAATDRMMIPLIDPTETMRPLVLAEPIGSIKVLQNNSVLVNLIHMNSSEDPVHLLLSNDGGKNFQDVELKYSNLILNLQGGKDYILKTRETGTKFNFTMTASDDNAEDELNSTGKIGCRQDGKFYEVGEEFHIGCTELCECTGADTRECVELVCPSHVGLELVSKGCVRWAPSPPAQPPNCCPRAARCLSDGTCHYKGVAIPNWSEVPISLTGCEQRCFCENGELDCQEVCSPLPPVPPQTLRCPRNHRPAPVNVSDDDCCKEWGCVPNAGMAEDTIGSTLLTYSMSTLSETPAVYVTPMAPTLSTSDTSLLPTLSIPTSPSDFYRHLHPVKSYPKIIKTSVPIPVINDPQKYLLDTLNYHIPEDLHSDNITFFTLEDADAPINVMKPETSQKNKANTANWKLITPQNNAIVTDNSKKMHVLSLNSNQRKRPKYMFSDAQMHELISPSTNLPTKGFPTLHQESLVKKVPLPDTKVLNYFVPAFQTKMPTINNLEPRFNIESTEDSQPYFEPALYNKSSDNVPRKELFHSMQTYNNRNNHLWNHSRGNLFTVENEKKNFKSNDNVWSEGAKAHVLIKAPNPYETVLLRPVPNTPLNPLNQHKKIQRVGSSALDLERLVNQMEMESEVNRNLERSADKVSKVGAAGQVPTADVPQTPNPQKPSFLPTIPPEIHFPQDEDYDNNVHRPHHALEPILPPVLPIQPNFGDENKKLTVISLQADSPTSVKLLFGLPPVLVGLRGSVDLRYTDRADEDISHWYSQVFAPADEVLTTPRLEFRLTGLKPSTVYRIRGKLYLHNLPVEPESEIYTVRTLDMHTIMPAPVEEKRREVDSRLTVVDVNDTAAHVSWRHFTDDELQFIDGIQVRYRPVGTPIYSMTELLHHSRSLAELHDLRPGSRYEASLILVPPPRATTELHDPGKVEFTTSPHIDPYNWTVSIDAHVVGSEAAELTWRGVPSPAERWVRVYRAAHACGASRREHDAFRLAARDLPPTVLLTGLQPNSRCRVWLELFLTNGKVKTSNVLEINTKSQDTPADIDNEIEASSVSGSRGSPRGDYYGALVVVGVVAALGALTSLLLLLVLLRRHRPRSVPITPVPSAPRESSLPPYDNPAYKLELQQETMDL